MDVFKVIKFKLIFKLLFFEQEYLSNHIIYQIDIFIMYSIYSPLVKSVSDFLIAPAA